MFERKKKKAKVLKPHSHLQILHFNGCFWSNASNMHMYNDSCSAGQDQPESTFYFPIHVTSGLNSFCNCHFDSRLIIMKAALQSRS